MATRYPGFNPDQSPDNDKPINPDQFSCTLTKVLEDLDWAFGFKTTSQQLIREYVGDVVIDQQYVGEVVVDLQVPLERERGRRWEAFHFLPLYTNGHPIETQSDGSGI